MSPQVRNIGVLMLAGLLAGSVARGGNVYRTDLLARMARLMQLTACLDTLSEGAHVGTLSYSGRPLTVVVSHGCVEHLGHTLFTSGQRAVQPQAACDFLERYSLELSLPLGSFRTVAQRLQEDKVEFYTGSLSFLRRLPDDALYRCVVSMVNERGYVVEWFRGNRRECQVAFPISHEELLGMDMLELQRRLPAEVARTDMGAETDSVPSRERLKKAWQENYYTLPGTSYRLPALNSHRYYELAADGELVPIYDSARLPETLSNLLTACEVAQTFTLEIQHLCYGSRKETFTVPLRQWIRYCQATGGQLFCGIIGTDSDRADVELVSRHLALGYEHVLRLSVPLAVLPRREGTISGRLSSYIPSSKITRLFDDIK